MAGTRKAAAAIRIAAVFALAIGCGAPAARADQEKKATGDPTELWLFFAPSGDGMVRDRDLKRVAGVLEKHPGTTLRPAVLVTDWKDISEPGSELADTVKGLRKIVGGEFSLALWDLEALAFAQAVAVERLPAYVLLVPKKKRRHAHVVYGAGADLEELFRCAKR